jgi:hypothetical protein
MANTMAKRGFQFRPSSQRYRYVDADERWYAKKRIGKTEAVSSPPHGPAPIFLLREVSRWKSIPLAVLQAIFWPARSSSVQVSRSPWIDI